MQMRPYFIFSILMLLMSNIINGQDFTQFKHTVSTSAQSEKIWSIWVDVPNWHTWDSGLQSATINGPFQVGQKGKIKPDKGPKAKFVISEMVDGKSYTFKTRIPFGWLIVKRYLKVENGQTQFTHDVAFTGLFKKTFAKKFGPRYKKMLPEVMSQIKEIAEK